MNQSTIQELITHAVSIPMYIALVVAVSLTLLVLLKGAVR